MLKVEQKLNTGNLREKNYTLIDRYLHVREIMMNRLLTISKYVVVDAYYVKAIFVQGLMHVEFHLFSRLRDYANLMYIYTMVNQQVKDENLKVYVEKIDFKNLDCSKKERIETCSEEEELYTLSKVMKRKIRLVTWKKSKVKHKLYLSTDVSMFGKNVVEFYRTISNIEFCFRGAKLYTGLFHSQARNDRKLDFAFNASFTAINAAKIMMK